MSEFPPCPMCSFEYTYDDGQNLVCPECAHEWKDGEVSEDEKVFEKTIETNVDYSIEDFECHKFFADNKDFIYENLNSFSFRYNKYSQIYYKKFNKVKNQYFRRCV